MAATEIDQWIGKTLFVPPIIKLCQLTRQSQYAVSRLFWFIAALDAFYRAENWFWSIFWGLFSVIMMVTAVYRADMPTQSSMVFRLLASALLLIKVLQGFATGQWAGIEFWLFVLVAEYAATIRSIPPTRTERREPRSVKVGS